jgi:hypothetical protein
MGKLILFWILNMMLVEAFVWINNDNQFYYADQVDYLCYILGCSIIFCTNDDVIKTIVTLSAGMQVFTLIISNLWDFPLVDYSTFFFLGISLGFLQIICQRNKAYVAKWMFGKNKDDKPYLDRIGKTRV